jgi:hypothetical protein
MTQLEIEDRLEDIASKVRSMRPPLNQRPEAWHEDKSELLSEITKLRESVRVGVRIA